MENTTNSAADDISATLGRLRSMSPAGFAIALHIGYTAPKYLFQSYDQDWIDTYSREGLVMEDPTVKWGFENTGAIRWSALAPLDTGGVLDRAAEHGMTFGVTAAYSDGGPRSVASFSRSDREATDAEMAQLMTDLEKLHLLTGQMESLSPEVHRSLRQMSIYLTHS